MYTYMYIYMYIYIYVLCEKTKVQVKAPLSVPVAPNILVRLCIPYILTHRQVI